jgi:muramoyltetrapeptide carboxypeptidase
VIPASLLYVRPRAVRPGDRVTLVAPASPIDAADLEAGAGELRRLGFEPVVHPSALARDGYLAGSAALRAAAFTEALGDPRTSAVLAVRGGYGSAQLLPHLSGDQVRRAGKMVVGYSDITALLSFVTLQAGVISVHGPMVDRRLAAGPQAYDEDSFLRVLGDARAYGPVPTTGMRVLAPGVATGPLVGGTLTQLVALLGTPYAFDPPAGAVLFVDEVNERPYRVDRMLLQLRLAGILGRVSGIVCNELPGCDEPGGGPTVEDAVRRAIEGLPVPVVTGLPSGHTARPMLTLPFGVPVTLRARGEDEVHLSIDGAAVQ